MQTMTESVRIGLGIIIENSDGKILVGKRKGAHASFYSIPGGHLELGETFEDGAIREIKEETDLDIVNPKVISVTNGLKTYKNEGLHYVSIALLATEFSGELKIMEPQKCEEWLWIDPHNLPKPHFDASEMSVVCYLENSFYKTV